MVLTMLHAARRSTYIEHFLRRSLTSTPILSPTSPMLPPFAPDSSFKETESPTPSWKLGEGLPFGNPENKLARQWKEEEKLGWTTLKLDEMEKP